MVKERHKLWWMLFLGLSLKMLIMNSVSVAIVSMIKSSPMSHQPKSACANYESMNPHLLINKTFVNYTQSALESNQFDWSENDRNVLLGSYSSFGWLAQICGTFLTHKFGGKSIFGYCILIGGLMSSLIPFVSFLDFNTLVLIRALQGFIAATPTPSAVFVLISKWAPPDERGTFVAVFLGNHASLALGYPLFGLICRTIGWPYVFHIISVLSLLWYIMWTMNVYESPARHPKIPIEERLYIIKSLGETVTEERLPIPWSDILLSVPFVANVICQFGSLWVMNTLNIYVPTYYKEVHGLDVEQSGIAYGITQLVKSIVMLCAALLTDKLLRKGIYSRKSIRKISGFIATIPAGCALFLAAYSECNTLASIFFIILCGVFDSFFATSVTVSVVDMSPNFSGVMQGLASMIAGLTGFLSPALATFFVNDDVVIRAYQRLMIVTAYMYLVPGIIFILFGSSDLQPWNNVKSKNKNATLEMNNSKDNMNSYYKRDSMFFKGKLLKQSSPS